ncbi:MAG: TIGR02186 family protein [Hyphomicrobiales bacterium]|nr:TIGR02186 family protein [Hyphomicrobiales bacterium]MCY4054178.1 TIGR02186 family protein [Hyphomicrobiales bacterium]
MLGRLILFCSIMLPLAGWSADAHATKLSADVSSHLVAIESDFTGESILLFGTLKRDEIIENGSGGRGEYDVVVVVRGPDIDLIERRKERVLGIWANTSSALFKDVPGFYAVFSTRPLGIINAAGGGTARGLFERNQIGIENLALAPVALGEGAQRLSRTEVDEYRKALLRHKVLERLYRERPGVVDFLGDSLFRTVIDLPAKVPLGNYEIEVYLFFDGMIVDAQSLPLFVNKIGVGRYLSQTAQERPFIYGLCAVFLALLIGWFTGILFER